MIVSFFSAGHGKAANAINYLLGNDAEGKERTPPAVIFSGDKDLTSMLIDTNTRNGKKYSSGAIAFRDNEKPTKQELWEVIKSFREVFCSGMGEDKVNMLWVLHEDKGNTELHFIVPKIAIVGNRTKQFNICPPSKHSLQLQRDFSAYWNYKLGYEQVIEDPIKASFSKFDMKTSEGSKNKARKERLSYEIVKRIKLGKISNREELVKFLGQKDFEVTRQGKDYLSIKMPGKDKAIRFRGGCFVEGADYKELVKLSDRTRTKLTNAEYNQVVSRMNATIQYRMEFNEKNYTLRKRMPALKAGIATPQTQAKPPSVKNSGIESTHNGQPNKKNFTKPPVSSGSKSSESSTLTVSSGNSHGSLMASIGFLENKIFALGVKMSQVPIEQRTQIRNQIETLKIQLARMHQQLVEAKKAELNKTGLGKAKFR